MSSHWYLSVRVRALAAATLLLALVTGCGTSPVQPDPGSTGGLGGDPAPAPTGPEVLVVNPDGTVSYTYPPAEESGSLAADAPMAEVLPAGDRKLSRSFTVDGSVGGKLRLGRFVLLVPQDAFNGSGTVTMSMADSTVMILDLEIAPAELNGFQKAIDLAITTTDLSVSPDSLQLYYYNPDLKEWQSLACDNAVEDDPRLVEEAEPMATPARGVLTPLLHFSKYSAGKAGW